MIYLELFYVFFLIGLFTFGGGYAMIPMIQSEVVSRGWISASMLTDFIAISEVTPGPFAINISTFVGAHVGGVLGAICSLIAVVLPSFIIILIIALILNKFMSSRYVKGALNGVKPIVVGLILSTALFLFIKIIFFGGNELDSEFVFDLKSLTLFFILCILCLAYRKVTQKKINPIGLLILSACLGIIIFSI